MANAPKILERGTDGITVEAATPASQPGDVFPSGVILHYAGSAAPTNWLICDGTAVSRATFANLFAAIGTTYGAGDGSTTFNLPDMRGKMIVGKHSSGTFQTLGQSGGEENHTLVIAEMPSHSHGGSTGGQSANHTHTMNHDHTLQVTDGSSGLSAATVFPPTSAGGTVRDVGGGGAGSPVKTFNGSTQTVSNDHTHAITAEGSGTTHNNMPPYMVVHHIIKT